MKDLQFSLDFKFRIGSFTNDFIAKDNSGKTLGYVRQKMFKFFEHVEVFNDESMTKTLYNIHISKWKEYHAGFIFKNHKGDNINKILRKGVSSIWKSRYDILDKNDFHDLSIQEENSWAKLFDSTLGEIPILSYFIGYLNRPKYIMIRLKDKKPIVRLLKKPSFFGKKYKVVQLEPLEKSEEERVVLNFMMMILLERRRG